MSWVVGVESGKVLDRMQGRGCAIGRKRAKAEWAQATQRRRPTLKATLHSMVPVARKERMIPQKLFRATIINRAHAQTEIEQTGEESLIVLGVRKVA